MIMSEDRPTVPETENNNPSQESSPAESANPAPKPRILIGSQRNPEAYRPKPEIPVVADANAKKPEPLRTYDQIVADAAANAAANAANAQVVTAAAIEERLAQKRAESGETEQPARKERPANESRDSGGRKERGGREGRGHGDGGERPNREKKSFEEKKPRFVPFEPVGKVPVPNLRVKNEDEEAELAELFQDQPLDALFAASGVDAVASQEIYEESTKVKCKVVNIGKDAAFVDIGARDLGSIPLKQFPEEAFPAVGDTFDAVVTKFDKDEGLYEVSLPLAAAEVGDWSSVTEGAIVEARLVAVNKGGLECEVGKLRGFMPLGQMATFRIENPEQFIGERWKCLITEADPLRRNLVVSRRALMERENEEKREQLLAELEVGQVREGLVRKIIDVGAFVDLGGADGFIHISQMSWGRIKHPSEVLKEGDRVKVTVQKIDMDRNRISLSFKDESLDPWNSVLSNFQEGMAARGKVTAIMPFGAFVELVPGVEGLVHISEISYKRVNAVSDALQLGDWVDVKILSIDSQSRKMSLSIKQLKEDPKIAEIAAANAEADAARAAEEAKADAELAAVREKIRSSQPKGPLKGGVSTKGDDGEKFGLKW